MRQPFGRFARSVPSFVRDLTPDLRALRHSRDLRLLYAGQAVSHLGSAITTVALAVQAFAVAHSSSGVGGVSLFAVAPMAGALLVGALVADRLDRRMLIAFAQGLAALSSAGLALNAMLGWHRLYVLSLLVGVGGIARGVGVPARSAIAPQLLPAELLPGALSMNAVLARGSALLGPAIAGVVIGECGLAVAYAIDAAGCLTHLLLVLRMAPLPPHRAHRQEARAALRQGLGYLRHHTGISTLLPIDPRGIAFGVISGLIPALGRWTFHGDAATIGLLYAAPSAGALVGAAAGDRLSWPRRSGLVFAVAAVSALAADGDQPRLLPAGLLLAAMAGAADLTARLPHVRRLTRLVEVGQAVAGQVSTNSALAGGALVQLWAEPLRRVTGRFGDRLLSLTRQLRRVEQLDLNLSGS